MALKRSENSPESGVHWLTMRKSRVIAALMIGLALTSARAAEQVPLYLPAKVPNVLAVIKAPPEPGSAENRDDLNSVVHAQSAATPGDCARAKTLVDARLQTMFGMPYGPLTAKEVLRWTDLFGRIAADADLFAVELKRKFKRERPYNIDKRIVCLGKADKAFSYPSGSATIAAVFAGVLTRLYPNRSQEFLSRARQIGVDRVLVGAHHPADIRSGAQLGVQLEKLLWESKAFQAEVARIKLSKD